MSKTNFISDSTDSPRIFKNNFLEFISKSTWYMLLVYWIPIIIILVYTGIAYSQMSIKKAALLFLLGFCLWSLLEYLIHRFIYHRKEPQNKNSLSYKIHYLSHGFHHAYPNDKLRLVSPVLSTVMAIPVFSMFLLAFRDIGMTFLTFSGTILGYLCYGMTHYAIHHFDMKWEWAKKLRKHHLQHHYSDEHSRYGVSAFGLLWDYVFGTKGKG